MLRCEYLPKGKPCPNESKWLITIRRTQEVFKVCRSCYMDVECDYEGQIDIVAMSKYPD